MAEQKTGIGAFLDNVEEILGGVEQRPFDRYVLGPFLIWYGLKSKKMGKWPRRLIVTAGIYQLFYNWNEYRNLQAKLSDPEPSSVLELINTKVLDS